MKNHSLKNLKRQRSLALAIMGVGLIGATDFEVREAKELENRDKNQLSLVATLPQRIAIDRVSSDINYVQAMQEHLGIF
jgi:hypothetical protein